MPVQSELSVFFEVVTDWFIAVPANIAVAGPEKLPPGSAVAAHVTDRDGCVVPMATASGASQSEPVRTLETLQGRLAAASGAVHFDRLRSAVQAIHVRADGASLRVDATLSADEVTELLNVQRLAQLFR